MPTLQLTVEYDGTHFHGWQIQKKTARTVQAEIKKAIKIILKEDVTLIGSGRTDSGVHALKQTAHFQTAALVDCPKFQKSLNAVLPHDIGIVDVKKTHKNFHAQYGVKSKTYRYHILNRPTRPVLLKNFVHFYPYPLNLRAMKQAAKALKGRKDFKAFTAKDPSSKGRKNTIRTIQKITITKTQDLIMIEITSNGFLYKMVRNIVGTLIEVGAGKRPARSIESIIESKNRRWAGPTAPAKGLMLFSVKY